MFIAGNISSLKAFILKAIPADFGLARVCVLDVTAGCSE